VTGEITQPHARPWSTAFRIPTDQGVAWCKASAVGPAYEGALLAAFDRWGVRGAIVPLAVEPERALMVLPDGGPTLRETLPDGRGDRDLDAWARILRAYARLQRSVESHADDLVAMGVPDLRPDRLVAVLEGMVDDDAVWAHADPEDRDAARDARKRLPGLVPRVATMADDVAALGVPASVQHDDLHGGNILVGPAGDRVFDWGDASIAHPFTTLTTTLNSIEYHAGIDQHGPESHRLRDAYLEAWADVAPLTPLVAAEARTRVLGAISRAASWERSMRGIEPTELEDYASATASWLIELVERLDRWSAATAPTR
jgi:Ser/Thr protein kinase RdoA (MazF antagonist)